MRGAPEVYDTSFAVYQDQLTSAASESFGAGLKCGKLTPPGTSIHSNALHGRWSAAHKGTVGVSMVSRTEKLRPKGEAAGTLSNVCLTLRTPTTPSSVAYAMYASPICRSASMPKKLNSLPHFPGSTTVQEDIARQTIHCCETDDVCTSSTLELRYLVENY